MSIKANVFANFLSQIYAALIGVAMVPVLLRHMGAEAYGLVGFFAMLQGWFVLLDMGFAAALSREAARRKGCPETLGELRLLLYGVEKLFFTLAIGGSVLALVSASFITEHWLKVEGLPLLEVRDALILMTITALLRWLSGLYRGVISGLERQIWLSLFNILVVTLRFVAVVPLFIFVSSGSVAFFSYQLAVALLELASLAWMTRYLLPSSIPSKDAEFRPLHKLAPFAVSMALAVLLWTLATQIDKLLLSSMLPLSEYGYFSVAVAAASVVMMLSTPVATALLPRLAHLEHQGDAGSVVMLYRESTQLISALSAPAVLILTCFSEPVLWLWTGDAAVVNKSAPLLALYAAGYGILVLSGQPYYVQHAKGDLRLHLLGTSLFILILLPLLFLATKEMGMVGAGWAWLLVNALFFFTWVPIAHRHFFPGLHLTWLVKDITPVVLPASLCAAAMAAWMPWSTEKIWMTVQLAGIALLLSFCAAVGSRRGRHYLQINFAPK